MAKLRHEQNNKNSPKLSTNALLQELENIMEKVNPAVLIPTLSIISLHNRTKGNGT
jgi:hypothetical protein